MSIQPNRRYSNQGSPPAHTEPNYRQIFPDLSRFVPICTLEAVSSGVQGAARGFEPSHSPEFRVMKSQPSALKLSHLCPSAAIRAHLSTDMEQAHISSYLVTQEYPGV